MSEVLWIAHCTRPDIRFAVHKATHGTHQPTTNDWKLAKGITRYLKETKGWKVVIESRSDADFAADK